MDRFRPEQAEALSPARRTTARQLIAEQSTRGGLHRSDPKRDEGQVHCGGCQWIALLVRATTGDGSSPMDGERWICRVLGHHRSTQRYQPRGREDEDRLVLDMIELAKQYGGSHCPTGHCGAMSREGLQQFCRTSERRGLAPSRQIWPCQIACRAKGQRRSCRKTVETGAG